MYKRFSLDELQTIQNDFIPHLQEVIKREIRNPRDQNLKAFLKLAFSEGDEVYYYFRSDVIFWLSKTAEGLSFFDERDKIEVFCKNSEEESKLMRMLLKFDPKKQEKNWQKTIEQILMDEFKTGKYSTILGKPYLVYDIETTVVDDLKSAKYLLGYAMHPKGDRMEYECVMQKDLKDFVDRMLAFDGYIIGFNQIWFDNPVSIYNVGYGQAEIDELNRKSIDLYLFFLHLTKKRIGLNKLSEALIGVTKTLSSGAEGEVLWKQYQESWDESLLNQFKEYCKNDVRMTALVMFYFLYYLKIFHDGQEYSYTLQEFVAYSNNHQSNVSEDKNIQNQSIFG